MRVTRYVDNIMLPLWLLLRVEENEEVYIMPLIRRYATLYAYADIVVVTRLREPLFITLLLRLMLLFTPILALQRATLRDMLITLRGAIFRVFAAERHYAPRYDTAAADAA